MARGEEHGYVPAAGAFLASPHVAQEIAWLQAEVTWAVADGHPPMRLEGGAASLSGEVTVVTMDDASGALIIPAGGPRLRCHALLYALGIETVDGDARVAVELAALEDGEWRSAARFEMPSPGTYLGFVGLEKRPRTIEAVRISLDGAREVRLYDLALLTFG